MQNEPKTLETRINDWLATQGGRIHILDTLLHSTGRMDTTVTVMITYEIVESNPWEGTPP